MKTSAFKIIIVFLTLLLSGSCVSLRPIDTDSPKTETTLSSPIAMRPPDTLPPDTTPAVESEATAEEITVVEPITESVVSFVGAGDNIVYYGNVRDAASCRLADGRSYNFAPTYTDVAPFIKEADIAFINQETLMCGEGYEFSYYPRFNGPQDLAYDLAEAGFDVVNIANNHMLDKGADGLSATIDHWNSFDGITLLGGHKSKDDFQNIRVLTVNEIRIAFLSYTVMTNGLVLPSDSPLYIPYAEDTVIDAQLARARKIADYIVVSVHWGDENTFTPNEHQRSCAKRLSEGGADVILGHHPHVIQPIEWIERADGTRTLCVYSLGNFVAEMAQDYNMLGGLISFDIVRRGDTITTENVLFTPTVYYFTTRFYQNHVYLLQDFTETLAASHGLQYYGRTLSLSTLKKYLSDTISDEFLPVPPEESQAMGNE